MKYTNNLNLKKPDQVDFYDVDDFNFNADELDKKIGEILNAIIIASQNEAETGTDNVRLMSPLRVKQAILKLAPKPAMATQTEAEAGTDNTKHMTALRVKQSILKNAPAPDLTPYAKLVSPAFTGTPTAPTVAKTTNNTQLATTAFVHSLAGAVNNGGIVAQSLGQNGYVKFANGLILQWGLANKTANGYSWMFKYPINFSTFCLPVFTPLYPNEGSSTVRSLSITSFNNSECALKTDAQSTAVKGLCIVIGQ